METKTIKANISGRLFEFELDAYHRLDAYLNSMRRRLKLSPQEVNETMTDIEARIAELLHEKVNEGNAIIKLEHVIRIISVVGEAEQIEDESENFTYQSSATYNGYRRLYRVNNGRILGGVCGGLGEYLKIDSIWARIIFIASLFLSVGISLLVYIILWIIVPNESSAFQKKNPNVSPFNNIKSNVKSEYQKTSERIKDFANSDRYEKTTSRVGDTFRENGNALGGILKIAVVIVAFLLFIKGVLWLTGAHVFHWNFPRIHVHNIFNNAWHWWDFNAPFANLGMLGVLGTLLIVIPLLFLFIILIKAIFNLGKRNKVLGAVFLTFWLLILIGFVMFLSSVRFPGDLKNKMYQQTDYSVPAGAKILVKFTDEKPEDVDYFTVFNHTFLLHEDGDNILQQPDIRVRTSKNNDIKVKIEKHFFAFENLNRQQNRLYRDFDWYFKDSVLYIDRYFKYDRSDWWQMPQLKMYIYLPENQEIEFEGDVAALMN